MTSPRYILHESSGRTTDNNVHEDLRYLLLSHCITKCVLLSLPTQTHACDNSVTWGIASALVSKAQQQQDSILSTFGFNANSAAHVTVKSQFELGLIQIMKSVIKCWVLNSIQAMTKEINILVKTLDILNYEFSESHKLNSELKKIKSINMW